MQSIKIAVLLFLIYGVIQSDGHCKKSKDTKSPCKNGGKPLADVFCGRGVNRTDCPEDYECVIAPDDRFAVCCPLKEMHDDGESDGDNHSHSDSEDQDDSVHPGSCPPSSEQFGICLANCETDHDCKHNQKCCGSCPRDCVDPVFDD